MFVFFSFLLTLLSSAVSAVFCTADSTVEGRMFHLLAASGLFFGTSEFRPCACIPFFLSFFNFFLFPPTPLLRDTIEQRSGFSAFFFEA